MGSLVKSDYNEHDKEINELKSAIKRTKNVRMHKRYLTVLLHFKAIQISK